MCYVTLFRKYNLNFFFELPDPINNLSVQPCKKKGMEVRKNYMGSEKGYTRYNCILPAASLFLWMYPSE